MFSPKGIKNIAQGKRSGETATRHPGYWAPIKIPTLKALYKATYRVKRFRRIEGAPCDVEAFQASGLLVASVTQGGGAAPLTLGYDLLRLQRKEEDDAEALYRQTLEIQRRVLGEEHPGVALSLHNLAETLEKMQRWSEAEPLCRQAGSIWAVRLPADHVRRRYSNNLLGGILAGLGRFTEAEPLLLESYEALRDAAGLEPTQKKSMLERFVRLYDAWDAAEPGRGHAEKAAEWRAKMQEEATLDASRKGQAPLRSDGGGRRSCGGDGARGAALNTCHEAVGVV